MLSNAIKAVGEKVDYWGYRITKLAKPVERFEAWLEERNLDVWELGAERENTENLLHSYREDERRRNREIDRLAAMYWRATGRWPLGHPQTTHFAFQYPSAEIAREEGLPEGTVGQRIYSNVPVPKGAIGLRPPSRAKLIPMNRYGERIDLSEVEGKG